MDLIEEYRRAVLFMDAGDPAEAARILESVLLAEPANGELRLRLALAYFASAQLPRAELELRALIERDPSDHYAQHVLGRTLERLSRPAEALGHLRLAEVMAPRPEYREAVERVSGKVNG